MAKTDKREVRIDLHDIIHGDSFEGKLEDIQKMLKEIPLKILSKTTDPNIALCHRFAIRTHQEWDYDNSYTTGYIVECYRWETDKELKKRISDERRLADSKKKQAQRERLAKEKREKTMYENLKKKFDSE